MFHAVRRLSAKVTSSSRGLESALRLMTVREVPRVAKRLREIRAAETRESLVKDASSVEGSQTQVSHEEIREPSMIENGPGSSKRWTVDENATVFDATRIMVEEKTGSLCVTRGPDVVGIVTERDYLTKVLHQGKTSKTALVKEIATMDAKLVVASLDDSLQDCVDVMARRKFRHLPVAEKNGTVVGLLSLRDIVAVLAEERREALARSEELRRQVSMPIHDG